MSLRDLPFVVLAVASGAMLVYLGRSLTFWYDEWRSITFDGSAIDFLRPVNEHWSTFPLLLYRTTFAVVGLQSYLPYLVEVIVLHLVAVTAAYALMRKRVGPIIATLFAVPLLLLGSGSENLFWAYQTGFVGSVAFGLWALFFLERPGRSSGVVASALLLASLASSGIGLCFLVVAAGRALFDPARRVRALAVLPPAAAYLVWFVLVGREPVSESGPIVNPASIARFVIRGVAHAFAEMSGVDVLPQGLIWGFVLFLVLTALVAFRGARGADIGLAGGCVLGIGALYVLIALVRADLEIDFALFSRYVYVAAFLLVLSVVDLLRASSLVVEPRAHVAVVSALGLVLLSSIAANLDALEKTRSDSQYNADFTRAYVALALAHGNEPWVDQGASVASMPPVRELAITVKKHGSPLHDDLVPGVTTEPSARAKENAVLELARGRFRVEQATRGGISADPHVLNADDIRVDAAGRCIQAQKAGPGGTFTLAVPGGSRVRIRASSDVVGRMRLGHDKPPSLVIKLDLMQDRNAEVAVPDIGDGRPWGLGFDLPGADGVVTVCAHMRPVEAPIAPLRSTRG